MFLDFIVTKVFMKIIVLFSFRGKDKYGVVFYIFKLTKPYLYNEAINAKAVTVFLLGEKMDSEPFVLNKE